MDFLQVVTTSLDFSIANNGTIQSYNENHEKLKIQSRTTRTEILVEREAGDWQLTLMRNEQTTASQTVSTKEQLLTHLSRFWRDVYKPPTPPILPPSEEC